jgi:hypothetical protein
MLPFSVKTLWSRRPLWQRLLLVGVMASLFVAAGLASGIAGDCHPGDHDGQCGLSTFVGLLNGLAAGAVVLTVGAVGVIVQWRRAKRQIEQ